MANQKEPSKEDMLSACILDFKGSWDDHLHLVEFFYNNNYLASIQMALYEALYGKKCRSPVCWDGIGERKLLGPDLILQIVENVAKIKKHMKAAQDRQKKWADAKRRPLEFAVGDHVFLRSHQLDGSLGSAAVKS